MTLVKRGTYWHYDFWYRGRRYQQTTEQELREDAEQVERDAKRRLRREAHGIETFRREDTPTFQSWAHVYLARQRTRLTRPELAERTTRMVLAFWGAKPRKQPVEGGPYHDLVLADPILDARWIERFEDWMAARGLSGSTKNSYRSILSGMYKLALRPRYRQRTRVLSNPFTDIDRDPQTGRRVHLPPEDLRKWLEAAPPHAVLALAIGALAPKLRLAQVLALRFDRHLDRELRLITFEAHKTRRHTRAPQVTAVSEALRTILTAIRDARPGVRAVITWRGQPVQSIRGAVKRAAEQAGLAWGVKGGVTFHALRHAFAVECARAGVAEVLAAGALGHLDPRTTRKFYTHTVPSDQLAVYDTIAERLGITQIATEAVGKLAGTRPRTQSKSRAKRQRPKTLAKRARSR